MTKQDYLELLVENIHSTTIATIGADGHPQTRMEDYLGEWKLRKEQLANGEITQEEYTEWRLNWPATADACYPETYHRKWRKEK